MARLVEYIRKLAEKGAGIDGYHYTKGGNAPANMLNLSPEDTQKALAWYAEHTPDKNSKRYLRDRRLLEKMLLEAAREKLNNEPGVKHPLYFRVGKSLKWSDGTNEYSIAPELLEQATFNPGDSFDYLRSIGEGSITKRKRGYSPQEKEALKQLILKSVMTFKDVQGRGIANIPLKERKDGNYLEGNLWAPYEIGGKKIIPKKGSASAWMSFPSDEHASLRNRLDAGKPIYTTRVSAEMGKYRVGQIVDSPIGKLKVESLNRLADAFEDNIHRKHQAKRPDWVTQLKGVPGDNIKLVRA